IIREAIANLQSKGMVINPRTIADEIRNTPSLFGQWPSFNRKGDEKIVYPNKITEILNTNGIRFVSKDASRSDGSSDTLDDILSEADSTFRDDNLIDALDILKYLLSVECFLNNIQKQYIKLSLEGLEPKEI